MTPFTAETVDSACFQYPNLGCTFRTSNRTSVCPRFLSRVKSTMADNLIERATWPVDLSPCRPISKPWEFVTQYDGNWGDVLRSLTSSPPFFSVISFASFFSFLLCNTTIFMVVPWEERACFAQNMHAVCRYLSHQDVPLDELSR